MSNSKEFRKWMLTAILLTATVSMSRIAQAQWVVTYDESGTASYTDNSGSPNSVSIVDSHGASPYRDQGYDTSINDIINPTFTWQGTGTAPSTIYVLIFADVVALNGDAFDYPASLSASDGFGDPEQTDGLSDYEESSGKHLAQINNSSHSGTVAIPSFTLTGSGGFGDSDNPSVFDNWSVAPDTRGISIDGR